MKTLKTRCLALIVILCAAIGITASAHRGESPSQPPVAAAAIAQDTINLERRISLLEQRFYSIENTLNRLQQQISLSQRPTPTQSSERDLEINLLRAEAETLRRRIIEIECGLLKLDERTATPAAREARRRGNAANVDPCRLSADSPLRLSTRP